MWWRNVRFAFDWYKSICEALSRESDIERWIKVLWEMSSLRLLENSFAKMKIFVDSYVRAKRYTKMMLSNQRSKIEATSFIKWKEVIQN